MWSFCAERCQGLFSVLTLYQEPATEWPGRNNPAHSYLERKDERAPQCPLRSKEEGSGRSCPQGGQIESHFQAQINTWAKQVCIEHLLELHVCTEATSLTSWVCHLLAPSPPSQLGCMCLEGQVEAVNHSFHFWRCFFLHKRYVWGFRRNGYCSLLPSMQLQLSRIPKQLFRVGKQSCRR